MRLGIMSAALLLSSSSFACAQEVSFVATVNGVGQVFIANLSSGAGLTQLTGGPDTNQAPEWSSNGSELVFQRNGPDVGYAVMVMNANGTGLRDISPANGADMLPSWTPSGQILFSQVIQPPSAATMGVPETALMIMNANGTDRTMLWRPAPATSVTSPPSSRRTERKSCSNAAPRSARRCRSARSIRMGRASST